MKYREIHNQAQYSSYCKQHKELGTLLEAGKGTTEQEHEHYVLGLIIRDFENKYTSPFDELTPVDLLKALMDEHGYSGYRLAMELGVSQSVISEILNYKRGFSKDLIRALAHKFNLSQHSFLKEYPLTGKKVA
jgi:HTH-type transcriptional regulator/antitoxin HigA